MKADIITNKTCLMHQQIKHFWSTKEEEKLLILIENMFATQYVCCLFQWTVVCRSVLVVCRSVLVVCRSVLVVCRSVLG